MTNNSMSTRQLGDVSRLVTAYVGVAVATLVALVVLSAAAPGQASDDAWVHAVIVAAFAVLLPVRLRSARRGSHRALVAVSLIAAVLLVVNLVEAALPGLFPGWMRVEMVGIAALMAATLVAMGRAVRRR